MSYSGRHKGTGRGWYLHRGDVWKYQKLVWDKTVGLTRHRSEGTVGAKHFEIHGMNQSEGRGPTQNATSVPLRNKYRDSHSDWRWPRPPGTQLRSSRFLQPQQRQKLHPKRGGTDVWLPGLTPVFFSQQRFWGHHRLRATLLV